MTKLISIMTLIATLACAQTIYYNVQVDASGNIRGLGAIKSTNDIATASSLVATSNHFANTKATVVPIASTNGNLVTISGLDLSDTGINPSNLYWQVSFDNIAQVLASVGQANGIAQLNANGKIDASLIEQITVVFSGNEAQDVD